MIRSLDTATLGPIREEPNLDAGRARMVREALRSLGNAPAVGWMFNAIAQEADDATLATLGRRAA